MDQSQKKYAMQRITDALADKKRDLERKHTKTVRGATDADKLEAIREGNAYLRRDAGAATPLIEAYLFTGLKGEREELDSAAFDKEWRTLKDRAAKVKDEIMLGDPAEAKKLIQEFCK